MFEASRRRFMGAVSALAITPYDDQGLDPETIQEEAVDPGQLDGWDEPGEDPSDEDPPIDAMSSLHFDGILDETSSIRVDGHSEWDGEAHYPAIYLTVELWNGEFSVSLDDEGAAELQRQLREARRSAWNRSEAKNREAFDG